MDLPGASDALSRCASGCSDAAKTPEATLALLFDLLDQLPVSVAVYGADAGFPLPYCNPCMAEPQGALPPGLDLTLRQHRRPRDLAQGLVKGHKPERVRLNVAARDGRRIPLGLEPIPTGRQRRRNCRTGGSRGGHQPAPARTPTYGGRGPPRYGASNLPHPPITPQFRTRLPACRRSTVI